MLQLFSRFREFHEFTDFPFHLGETPLYINKVNKQDYSLTRSLIDPLLGPV